MKTLYDEINLPVFPYSQRAYLFSAKGCLCLHGALMHLSTVSPRVVGDPREFENAKFYQGKVFTSGMVPWWVFSLERGNFDIH